MGKKKKKTAENNEWAGSMVEHSQQEKAKTAENNEWASANKKK